MFVEDFSVSIFLVYFACRIWMHYVVWSYIERTHGRIMRIFMTDNAIVWSKSYSKSSIIDWISRLFLYSVRHRQYFYHLLFSLFFFLSAKAKWIFLPYIMPMIVISGSRRKQSFLMSFCDRKWKKKKIPRYIQITIEFWMPKKLFYFCFELQVILLHFFFESPENKSNEIKRR